ncbi:hypothetical protein JAAARDRAFT_629863 [Jaapia argillacea MUCL 33604]|uniref:Protein kinase domain-containing protein n=1 Tax=Jaapia argillacea MUCL 33604 TaxID=933084 RepID=A0A067Q0N6_9AGAM|nr:hypothetical protein JAAARDRAFT_629863 [Jaapia argillacea MUCL 33604]
MFGELCKAVAWMHSVGLVHRDIKLENILLTSNPFNALPPLTQPLIKLSDFGLSRFVDLDHPMLNTRCGSESYAAPELVTGRPYDGRETDAWALGVVLYAVVCRRLPFDSQLGDLEREREGLSAHGPGERGRGQDQLHDTLRAGIDERARSRERRSWLVRIAKGEYVWPEPPTPPPISPTSDSSSVEGVEDGLGVWDEVLRGEELIRSVGIKRVVGRLLIRNPEKRAKVGDVLGDEWVCGDGGVCWPVGVYGGGESGDDGIVVINGGSESGHGSSEGHGLGFGFGSDSGHGHGRGPSEEGGGGVVDGVGPVQGGEEEGSEFEWEYVVRGEEGMLVDGHDIGRVAREEVL